MPEAADRLLDDTHTVLTRWRAPDEAQEDQRGRFLGFLAEHGRAAFTRQTRVGHFTASTLVFDHSRERVLLTLHPMAGRWFQLGGHVEGGDATLADAALREAGEESGLTGLTLDPEPLGLDWHRVRCRDATGNPGPSSHLDVEHLAVAPAGAQARRSDESLALEWFAVDDLPDGADAVVRGLVRRAVLRGGD